MRKKSKTTHNYLIKKRFTIIKEKKIKVVGITDVSSGMFGIPAKLGREVLIKTLIK